MSRYHRSLATTPAQPASAPTAADSPAPLGPNGPARILIIRPSALGDVCRTVPVLVSLKRAFPRSQIDWMVQDTFADAIAAHPALHKAVLFPRKRFGQWWKPAVAREFAGWSRNLAASDYTLVVDCQGLLRSGLFAWITQAAVRIGYANAQELGWLGTNRRATVPTGLHTVDRMLQLAKLAGAPMVRDMRLYAPAEAMAQAAADPRLAGRFAVLAPTSRWTSKRWPIERFAELAGRLVSGLGYERVVLVGARSERDQCGPLLDLSTQDNRIVDLIGTTSVGALLATIARSSLVVANDSAALHIAVGFDRPLIGLYGPTDVNRVGPYGRQADVIQKTRPGESLDHKDPSTVEFMRRITVDEVAERIAGVHAGSAAGPTDSIHPPPITTSGSATL